MPGPYASPTLNQSAADLVPLAFDVALSPAPAILRISNHGATWATLSVVTLIGQTRVLDIPPGSVITETVRVSQLNSSGTTSGVTVMAYMV